MRLVQNVLEVAKFFLNIVVDNLFLSILSYFRRKSSLFIVTANELVTLIFMFLGQYRVI